MSQFNSQGTEDEPLYLGVMTDWYYGKQRHHDFGDVVKQFSSHALRRITRSTVPLLQWLGLPDNRRWLSEKLGLGSHDATAVHVEYPVRASCERCGHAKGRGKVSLSDAALRFAGGSAVLEAKCTEPIYSSVSDWLREGPRENRERVLAHWGHLIGPTLSLTGQNAGELIYQHVHRAASAQALAQGVAEGSRGEVVHVLFGGTDNTFYVEALKALKALLKGIGPEVGPRIWLAEIGATLNENAKGHESDEDASRYVVETPATGGSIYDFVEPSFREIA